MVALIEQMEAAKLISSSWKKSFKLQAQIYLEAQADQVLQFTVLDSLNVDYWCENGTDK